jgi:hypothetical protein
METPTFADKTHQPTDEDLAALLGRAKRLWDSLVKSAQAAAPGAEVGWKHYAGKSGWTFVVRDKRRNLAYLKPAEKRFTVNLALGEQALQAAQESDLPEAVVKAIAEAPKYPEGRPAHLTVKTAADLRMADKLLAIKIAN